MFITDSVLSRLMHRGALWFLVWGSETNPLVRG